MRVRVRACCRARARTATAVHVSVPRARARRTDSQLLSTPCIRAHLCTPRAPEQPLEQGAQARFDEAKQAVTDVYEAGFFERIGQSIEASHRHEGGAWFGYGRRLDAAAADGTPPSPPTSSSPTAADGAQPQRRRVAGAVVARLAARYNLTGAEIAELRGNMTAQLAYTTMQPSTRDTLQFMPRVLSQRAAFAEMVEMRRITETVGDVPFAFATAANVFDGMLAGHGASGELDPEIDPWGAAVRRIHAQPGAECLAACQHGDVNGCLTSLTVLVRSWAHEVFERASASILAAARQPTCPQMVSKAAVGAPSYARCLHGCVASRRTSYCLSECGARLVAAVVSVDIRRRSEWYNTTLIAATSIVDSCAAYAAGGGTLPPPPPPPPTPAAICPAASATAQAAVCRALGHRARQFCEHVATRAASTVDGLLGGRRVQETSALPGGQVREASTAVPGVPYMVPGGPAARPRGRRASSSTPPGDSTGLLYVWPGSQLSVGMSATRISLTVDGTTQALNVSYDAAFETALVTIPTNTPPSTAAHLTIVSEPDSAEPSGGGSADGVADGMGSEMPSPQVRRPLVIQPLPAQLAAALGNLSLNGSYCWLATTRAANEYQAVKRLMASYRNETRRLLSFGNLTLAEFATSWALFNASAAEAERAMYVHERLHAHAHSRMRAAPLRRAARPPAAHLPYMVTPALCTRRRAGAGWRWPSWTCTSTRSGARLSASRSPRSRSSMATAPLVNSSGRRISWPPFDSLSTPRDCSRSSAPQQPHHLRRRLSRRRRCLLCRWRLPPRSLRLRARGPCSDAPGRRQCARNARVSFLCAAPARPWMRTAV